jgi:competence protein ComEC
VLSILVAALTLGRRAWAFGLSMGALGLMTTLVAIHPFSPRLPSGILEVTALDCGQGDSLFLVLPDKTTMLVDASGTRHSSTSEGAFQGRLWDPGEDIVSPYLWSRGIKRIDIVVLSHPHEDHLGGLFAIVRNFQIGEFWHAVNSPTPAYSSLLERVREKGVAERTLAAGDGLQRGRAAVRALWPKRSWRPSGLPSNDDSLVLRLSYQGGSVLLTGDISTKVERQLLASGQSLDSEVLKVAHHGSNSSSSAEFLARVNPRLAMVTGGSGGFGELPSPETLARLRERGIRVFRPDLEGATTVQVRDGSIAVRCYGPKFAPSTTPAAGVSTAGGLTLQVR